MNVQDVNRDSKNQGISFYTRFSFGFSRSCFIWCFILLFPRLFTEFFIIGIEGLPLYLAIGCLLLTLPLHFLNRMPVLKKEKITIILKYIAGFLGLFSGLMFQFDVDGASPPTILILSILLCCSYLIALFDFSTYRHYSNYSKRGNFYEIIGWATSIGLIGLINSIFTGYYIFFYGLGVFYLLSPLLTRNQQIPSVGKPHVFLLKNRLQSGFHLLFNNLILALILSFIYLGSVVYNSMNLGWSMLGIALGLLAWGSIPLEREKSSYSIALILLGFSVFYLFFIVDPTIIYNNSIMFLLGVLAGILTTDAIESFRLYPSDKSQQLTAQIFFFMLISGALGVLASQLRWVIRDYSNMIGWGSAIIAILGFLALSLELSRMGSLYKREIIHRIDLIWHDLSVTMKKRIPVASLICLIAIPLFLGILYRYSQTFVTIQLEQTMYDVNGNPVTTLTLREKTAKILFYEPPTTGHGGLEDIRPGKSIRLGAYFYGGTSDTTSDEATDFIGNNMDVVAMGGWIGWYINLSHIETMRSMNSRLKLYGMTFATTYWEDPRNNITETGGILTYNYSWGIAWNSTMHEWTLKNKTGQEIYGVRHGPNSPYDHIMDMGSEAWAEYYAWFFDQRCEDFNLDGMAADEVMWRGYWGTDEADLHDYSNVEQITQTCYLWLQRVDSRMQHELITQAYWSEAQQYQQGVWGEIAFRCGGQYGGRVDDRKQVVFYESMDWEEIVENMVEIAGNNKSYIWAAWYKQNNTEDLEYALGTYMMGKPNNNTYLAFHPQPVYNGGYPANLAGYDIRTVINEVNKYPEYFDMELGDALGPMYKINGNGGPAWRRDFERGIVFVNPYHAHIPGFDSNNPVWAPSH